MAGKRMFAKQIINSDAFMEMPLSTQALYFHLGMEADDEGFVNNPKMIQRMIGASEDDLKVLIAKRFVIWFESGVIVLKHWKIHNYIPKDRFKATTYQEERKMLSIKENGAYSVENSISSTPCIQDVYEMDTQIRLDKDRVDKNRLDKNKLKECSCSYTRVWDELSDEDTDWIINEYHEGLDLINEVADEVKRKQTIIEGSVRNYIIGYADNKGTLTEKEYQAMKEIMER